MKKKEAVSILGTSRNVLSYYLRKGMLRHTAISYNNYEYNDEDVHRLKCKIEFRRKKLETHNGVTPEMVIHAYGWDLAILRNSSRNNVHCDLRRVVAFVLRNCGFTLDRIASVLNRSRASVIHMLKTSYLANDGITESMERLDEVLKDLKKQ